MQRRMLQILFHTLVGVSAFELNRLDPKTGSTFVKIVKISQKTKIKHLNC